jgi:hypothetical protein
MFSLIRFISSKEGEQVLHNVQIIQLLISDYDQIIIQVEYIINSQNNEIGREGKGIYTYF